MPEVILIRLVRTPGALQSTRRILRCRHHNFPVLKNMAKKVVISKKNNEKLIKNAFARISRPNGTAPECPRAHMALRPNVLAPKYLRPDVSRPNAVYRFRLCVLKAEGLLQSKRFEIMEKLYTLKALLKMAGESMHTPHPTPLYPPLAISYRNRQRSLAYFSHLAPLILLFLLKSRAKRGPNAPPPYMRSCLFDSRY